MSLRLSSPLAGLLSPAPPLAVPLREWKGNGSLSSRWRAGAPRHLPELEQSTKLSATPPHPPTSRDTSGPTPCSLPAPPQAPRWGLKGELSLSWPGGCSVVPGPDVSNYVPWVGSSPHACLRAQSPQLAGQHFPTRRTGWLAGWLAGWQWGRFPQQRPPGSAPGQPGSPLGSPGLWACLCLYMNLAGTSWVWQLSLPSTSHAGLPPCHARGVRARPDQTVRVGRRDGWGA